MVQGECPLHWGDRISHKLFGFGTVNGEPVAVMGGDLWLGTVLARWRIPVEWDDIDRSATSVLHTHLEKVSSPAAKGAHYWHYQWKLLSKVCMESRRATDIMLSTGFRTEQPFPEAQIILHLETEQKAINSLIQFLREDAAGEHL